MSRAMPHFHSGRLYSSVFDPARWNKATRPTVTSHHALATLQMHERERKNSPPAALSSHCLSPLPLYPLWMSLKKKAGSFPPDWLKALILFCPTFQQCLRCVCVCGNRQLTFNGISGSRCVWENLIKRINSCYFLSSSCLCVELQLDARFAVCTETL